MRVCGMNWSGTAYKNHRCTEGGNEKTCSVKIREFPDYLRKWILRNPGSGGKFIVSQFWTAKNFAEEGAMLVMPTNLEKQVGLLYVVHAGYCTGGGGGNN